MKIFEEFLTPGWDPLLSQQKIKELVQINASAGCLLVFIIGSDKCISRLFISVYYWFR